MPYPVWSPGQIGAPGKIQTSNLLVRSQAPYPVRLRGHVRCHSCVSLCSAAGILKLWKLRKIPAVRRIGKCWHTTGTTPDCVGYRSIFEYPQGWPMGFKPIMTGATSQRVNRFATATPVDTRGWSPITESNSYLLDVSRVSWPLDEWDLVGGTGQIQTASLLFANQALYRLNYGPVTEWCPIAELNCCCLVENQMS